MYKRVETDKSVWWGGIAVLEAIATLENECGERAHWIEDGNGYILLVRDTRATHSSDCYKPSPWIFPEAAEVLADIINNERWKYAKDHK